ncbi:MAG: Hsp20/alpha crystallin family protein [Prevotella sp.]|nr:Hsp20/alpha crystallin family protein [Prevotella sp.]
MYPVYRNSWLPEVFNDFFNTVSMPKANATAPAINVKETADEYIVELAAPGMTKDDFDVHINADGDLTIKMESKHEKSEEDKKAHYLRREFAYSKYEQTLILPDDVNRDNIAARVAEGVLTVDLPKVKKEEHKVTRQITVA